MIITIKPFYVIGNTGIYIEGSIAFSIKESFITAIYNIGNSTINLAAAYFKVPIELIEYKTITLKDIGENFSNSIETPLSSCLANIPIADLIF